MITAKWKVPGLFRADATTVAMEVMAIGDNATPDQIVECARDESKELHKCFTWDNDKAADKWRKQEARQIMCTLVIEHKPEDREKPDIRVFWKNDAGTGYKAAPLVFKQSDEYEKLLISAKAELRAFKQKYSMLKELDEILALID